ncbi:MAG: hypothetical protein ABJB40_10105 [Acidobacteriota bacterium]
MPNIKDHLRIFAMLLIFALSMCISANAQNKSGLEVLSDAALTKVVPTSFYFAGQSAVTQIRNTAAAQLGKDRFVIVGLVDTSGYSTEISGKYEGFLITDSPILIGNKNLGTGAYGFGFSKSGTLNIFDLSSKQILSTASKSDADIKRPRPLQMILDNKGVRLYKGKDFVLITPK